MDYKIKVIYNYGEVKIMEGNGNDVFRVPQTDYEELNDFNAQLVDSLQRKDLRIQNLETYLEELTKTYDQKLERISRDFEELRPQFDDLRMRVMSMVQPTEAKAKELEKRTENIELAVGKDSIVKRYGMPVVRAIIGMIDLILKNLGRILADTIALPFKFIFKESRQHPMATVKSQFSDVKGYKQVLREQGKDKRLSEAKKLEHSKENVAKQAGRGKNMVDKTTQDKSKGSPDGGQQR